MFDFVKSFFLHLLIWAWFLFFILLMWYSKFIVWWMLNHPCIPGINFTWLCCMILPIYRSIWLLFDLLLFCWGFFHLCPSRILACSFSLFSLFVISFFWLWCQSNDGFVKCIWKISILFNFLKKICIKSYMNAYRIF